MIPKMQDVIGYKRRHPHCMYGVKELKIYAETRQWDYDADNPEFEEMVKNEGYKLPSQATIDALEFYNPGVYQSRLQDIWERYQGGYRPMAEVNVVFEYDDGTRESNTVEIPLSVKGAMWAWLVDKPVANKNPYRTLLEHLCAESCIPFDYDSCLMYVSENNHPRNFDKRVIKPTKDFVVMDETLDDDQIVIEGKMGNTKRKTKSPEPQDVSKRVAMDRLDLAQAQLGNEVEALTERSFAPDVKKISVNNGLNAYMEALKVKK